MEHIVFEKKNLGLIALFLVLIAAVVLLTTEEEHEEEMPLRCEADGNHAAQHAAQRGWKSAGFYHPDQSNG